MKIIESVEMTKTYDVREFFQMDRTTLFMSNGNDVKVIDLRNHINSDPVTDEELLMEKIHID